MFAHDGTHRRMLAAVLAFAAPAFLLTACNDEPLFDLPPDAPTDVTAAVQGTSVTIAWTPGPGATSQEVRVASVLRASVTGTNLLVLDDLVQVFNDNTTSTALFEDLAEGPYTATVTAINASQRTSSELASFTIAGAVNAPTLTTFAAVDGDPTQLLIEWTAVDGAENYRVVLTGDDGADPIQDIAPASATAWVFESVVDGTTYTAQVCAIFGTEEFCSNTLDFAADFFPWDDYFPTSLHESGMGKITYYSQENGGFERFTGVPYATLGCVGCHSSADGRPPVSGRTCDRCHDTADPGPGAEVDSSWETGVCIGCHSRQTKEASVADDVHRTMGFDCMACHTMEDVHGDGTQYTSYQDIGAIDTNCETCHDVTQHTAMGFHEPETDGRISCAACHAQTVVTCNNCHFEAQLLNPPEKVFHDPVSHDYIWLANRLKRDGSGETEVYPANYQSVTFEDNTYVAFGHFTPHTIGLPGRTCTDCHNNQGGTNSAIIQYNASGTIDVAQWDGSTLNYHTGVIPLPEDYLTSLKFDFVTTTDGGTTWDFLKAGADTIRIPEQFVTPLTFDQMSDLGMEWTAP